MEKPRVEKPRPHEFDVFLSHKFVVRKHAPITLEIYEQLTSSGLKVWMDKHEMGHDMVYSMKHGIARSGCVVALMTKRYGTDADSLSLGKEWDPLQDNCVKELVWAKQDGKVVIACLVDPDDEWFPSETCHIVKNRLVAPKRQFMLNFTADPAGAQKNLLKFVREAISPTLKKGCYSIVPALRHGGLYGVKGYCFDVKEMHDLHTSNDPIIIWNRKDLVRKDLADSQNQLFYVERVVKSDIESDVYVLRAKCCTDAKRNAFLGVAADKTLLVSDKEYHWRIVRASSAFTIAPADDANLLVELTFIFTVFGAQPRVAGVSSKGPQLKHMFHFCQGLEQQGKTDCQSESE